MLTVSRPSGCGTVVASLSATYPTNLVALKLNMTVSGPPSFTSQLIRMQIGTHLLALDTCALCAWWIIESNSFAGGFISGARAGQSCLWTNAQTGMRCPRTLCLPTPSHVPLLDEMLVCPTVQAVRHTERRRPPRTNARLASSAWCSSTGLVPCYMFNPSSTSRNPRAHEKLIIRTLSNGNMKLLFDMCLAACSSVPNSHMATCRLPWDVVFSANY